MSTERNSPEAGMSPLVMEMESLELNELVPTQPSCSQTNIHPEALARRRSLRKRIPTGDNKEIKRRVTIKPKKYTSTEPNSTNKRDVKHVYLCKQLKRVCVNLETIFEEPKVSKNNEITYTALKKQKRFIVFEPTTSVNKGKIKKRQVKLKKIFGRSSLKRKRATMEALLEKLSVVE
ncbi:hypothetical protein CBL_00902 [Carabus blaptoides fortunei]